MRASRTGCFWTLPALLIRRQKIRYNNMVHELRSFGWSLSLESFREHGVITIGRLLSTFSGRTLFQNYIEYPRRTV
ncbi:hypothetical protein LENED_009294 [Lentinula edodes]|uniref:Uncharacterized protein n=1 Tax=Lentinula edodes TaxID=5353 RepID=A0A1Q3EJD2_LENED|nr:hypothetical protein LENED_009294 [Lentinula edodes]